MPRLEAAGNRPRVEPILPRAAAGVTILAARATVVAVT
jgi:hypothetical protein